jgi:hypothetical protein
MIYDAIIYLAKTVNNLRSEMQSEISILRSEMNTGFETLGDQVSKI